MRRTPQLALVSAVLVAPLFASDPARADEPEPTPMLPRAAPPPVVFQRHPLAPHDPPITVPRGPRRDPALFGAGIATTVVGGLAMAGGMLLVLYGTNDGPGIFFWPSEKNPELVTPGAITAVVGAVLVAVGIPMMVHNGKRLPPGGKALEASADGLRIVF